MFLTNPFDDPSKWNLVWDIDVSANQTTEGADAPFISIERLQCPLLLSYPIVCFEISNPHAKLHWKRAGFALQEIRTGILVGGQPETISSGKTVYLDELNFVTFNNYVDGYRLYFKPLFWHRQIILKAWEFTASPETIITQAVSTVSQQIDLLTEQLNNVAATLIVLDEKINAVGTIVTDIQQNEANN